VPPRSSERATRDGKIAIYTGERKNVPNVRDFSRTIDSLVPRVQWNAITRRRVSKSRKFRIIIAMVLRSGVNIDKRLVFARISR